jgi:NAD(P)H-quinone oxidoreductase subunit 4L
MMDRGEKRGQLQGGVPLAYAVVSFIIVVLLANGSFTQMMESINFKGYPDIYAFVVILFLGTFALLFGRSEPVPVMAIGTIASFFVLTIGQEPIVRYLTLAAVLFSIGMYGMVVSRNAVRVLMSIELMLNAVNLNLVTFARYIDPIHLRGQVFAVFILTVAAAEAAVGLAIVLAIYRNTATVDMERFKLLKW